MRRQKTVLAISAFVCWIAIQAQPMKFSYVLDEPGIVYSYRSLNNYEVIDSTVYTVVYDFTTSNDRRLRSEQSVLDIGTRYTVFYNWAERQLDSAYTAEYGPALTNAVNEYSGTEQIIRNIRTSELECCNRLPFVPKRVATYEDTPEIKWELLDRTDSIVGYPCRSAKTQFRGRTWIAWYSTDIPHHYGPWKFGGLPGLILKVEDHDGNYTWYCSGIIERNTPIKKYRWAAQPVTRKKWLKMERTIFLDPGSYASSQDIALLQMIDGHPKPTDGHWNLHYNPIELE